MKAYVISVIAAAFICGIVKTLLPPQNTTGRIVGLLTGVLMAVTVISPLAKISFHRIGNYFDKVSFESQSYITDGETAARESLTAVIKKQTEAYILDKATRLGLAVSVEVELDETNYSIPCSATIRGSVSPYARKTMSEYMEDTLGIAKENQKWI